MTRTKHERAQRAAETERAREIQAAWMSRLTPEAAAAFTGAVEAARARPPVEPRADMAPGTPPNPPRPGHEPKPPKEERRPRRRSF